MSLPTSRPRFYGGPSGGARRKGDAVPPVHLGFAVSIIPAVGEDFGMDKQDVVSGILTPCLYQTGKTPLSPHENMTLKGFTDFSSFPAVSYAKKLFELSIPAQLTAREAAGSTKQRRGDGRYGGRFFASFSQSSRTAAASAGIRKIKTGL